MRNLSVKNLRDACNFITQRDFEKEDLPFCYQTRKNDNCIIPRECQRISKPHTRRLKMINISRIKMSLVINLEILESL